MDDTTGRMETIEEAQCWELLRAGEIGRLAVAANNKPDVFPVNYKVANDRIVIRTAPGHKLAAAVLGTAVAFEIDEIDPGSGSGWSVVVKGPASEIEDLDGYLDAEDLDIEPWAGGVKLRFMEIVPEIVTGRVIPPLD